VPGLRHSPDKYRHRSRIKMIFSPSLKKSIFISLSGHIIIFSIFSFSFGYKIPKVNYASVSFWGAILRRSDLTSRENFKPQDIKKIFMKKPNVNLIERTNREFLSSCQSYSLKPAVFLESGEAKIIFVLKTTPALLPSSIRSQAIMFYPQLPYHFLIYFKDRQVAHIELMFNIISGEKTNAIVVKRKISSGNLEADLLSMRYIGHYLFIQQAMFSPNNWQTVKIDLSAKNDK